MRASDFPGIIALQQKCFPAPFPQDLLWQSEHLVRHIELFREGQFVAVDDDGKLIGSASNSLISEKQWNAHTPWDATLGGPWFGTFDPRGSTLYGADIGVDPAWRRQGVGRALYDARFGLVRKRNLARYGTACRIPGYEAWHAAARGTLDEYVELVSQRKVLDKTLTPLLQYGMRATCSIPDYMEDRESGNAAALLEWLP
jgi:GNAT superfamily N-acetyltransferase